MLSLGIPIDFDDSGNTIVDLNMGGELKVRDFPQDSEFQLLAFNPSAKTGTVIWIKQLAEDVGKAMAILDELGLPKGRVVQAFDALRYRRNSQGGSRLTQNQFS